MPKKCAKKCKNIINSLQPKKKKPTSTSLSSAAAAAATAATTTSKRQRRRKPKHCKSKSNKSKKKKRTRRAASSSFSKRYRKPRKPRKPCNAFFIFLIEFRQQVKKEKEEAAASNYKTTGHISSRHVCQLAGERWRELSPTEKLPYFVWAHKNRQKMNSKLLIASRRRRKKAQLQRCRDEEKAEDNEGEERFPSYFS